MEIVFQRAFKKQFKKLSPKVRVQFGVRLQLLIDDARHPVLRVHLLQGSKYPLQSMNVTGDYRALFISSKKRITFYEINTHSELYE